MKHSPELLKNIERAVSTERLKRYLAACSNDLERAVSLYEQNVEISEIAFGLLHGLEVAVRNSMHGQLTAHFRTPRWFDIAPLSPYSRDKVTAAIRDSGGPNASAGKVVAELTFGFWTDLAAKQYHWTLWQPCLNKAFRNARLARPLIHRRLEEVRWLRNRIAHHEPVLTSSRKLYAGHLRHLSLEDLAECSDWLSPAIGGWLRTHFRFAEGTAILDSAAGYGVRL